MPIMDTVVLSDSIPKTLIKSLFSYYEDPRTQMTVGELYLLLKLVVSKLEEEIEKMGAFDDIQNT